MVAVLVQIDGYDPAAAAAVTLYAGSHDDTAVCHLNGQTWMPALAKLPVLRYDLFDGTFGGGITTPSTSLTLQAEPWPNLGRYMLADARLRLWTGNTGDAWGSYTLRFDGRVTDQPKLADGKAEVSFAVDDRWLDTAFLTTYAGTTGIEGPAGLKGQVKPLALGAPAYVPGRLIDSVNSVFQVNAYGSVQGFTAALEKLARFGAATADYATYAALIAASLAPGTWATCKASGLARFGAPPTGQVSFLLQGDNSGTDGWARKPGQLIRRLALLSGGTGKVDDTSLNALDTARPYNLSLYLDEQTTARDAIQKIAASVNAVAGVSWTGQLFVLPVAIGTAAVTLAADGSALPPVGQVQQIEIAAPFKTLALTAERAWAVHQLSDIAFTATLIDLGAYNAATTYREGNIVALLDGSRYMYSAITPTSGNSPPNATYWTALPAAVSGSRSFNQSSAPLADQSAENDTWQDTSNGNLPYRRLPGTGRVTFGGNRVLFGGNAVILGPWAVARDDGKATTFRQNTTPVATAVGDTWFNPDTGVEKRWSGTAWELTTDATELTKVTIDQPASAVVACDYLGAPLTLELPRSVGVKVAKGGASITGDATVSYAATFTNVTGAMGDGTSGTIKGTAIITAMAANEGYMDVAVTVAGVVQQSKRTVFTKQLAQPPSSGGAGSKRATDTTLNSITLTSAVQISDTMTVTLATGESLYGTGSPDYYVDGVYDASGGGSAYRSAIVYWGYRVALGGGAFTAFASSITAATQARQSRYVGGDYTDPTPGNVNTAQTKSGLAAANYEVALFASMNAVGPTMTWDTNGGFVMVEAKV